MNDFCLDFTRDDFAKKTIWFSHINCCVIVNR
jgi:hypothetical protein